MNNKVLTAPQIDSYLNWLHHGITAIDEASICLVDKLFNDLNKIAPCGHNNRHELWLCAVRGPIEDFGDYEKMLANGEVKSRAEFEELWREEYPEEKEWYFFTSVEHNGYRIIILRHQSIIQINPNERAWGNSICRMAYLRCPELYCWLAGKDVQRNGQTRASSSA